MDNPDGPPIFEGDAPAAASPTALLDRRELALVAVERTRMPMVITDPRKPDNPIVLANQSFLDLTGYDASEIVGYNCRFLQGPETDQGAVDKLRRALKADEDHIAAELLNYRKDGSTFWNELAISAVRDEHGDLIYYFASQRDVTSERRAERMERAERMLLREIDHRAMNVLALVQSIVRLTRADTTERFTSRIGARVDSLARAHRLLSDSGWAQAEIHDVVALELPAEIRGRVIADGPSTHLRAQHVQPLTLVLHELVSNAIEHGALASSEGALTINWSLDAGLLSFRWTEQGGKQPVAPQASGFGLSLIRKVIEHQLGGASEIDWHTDGLRLQFHLPHQQRSVATH